MGKRNSQQCMYSRKDHSIFEAEYKKNVQKTDVFEKGMKVGLKEKSGKKKERVFWSNVRSVNVCCGAPVVVSCDWE